MRHSAVIGIDPGQQGAIALVRCDLGDSFIHDMPILDRQIDIAELSKIVIPWRKAYDLKLAIVEDLIAMPHQSSTTTLSMGINFGRLKCCIEMLEVPISTVTPSVWKRKMFGLKKTGADKKAIKETAICRAREYFPHHKDALLKSKDGRSEALLLAEYARRLIVGAVQ